MSDEEKMEDKVEEKECCCSGKHHDEHAHHHHGHHHEHEHSHHHHHCACHDDGDDDDEEEEGFPWKLVISAVLFVLALLVEKLPFFSLNGNLVKGNETFFIIIKAAYLVLYFAAYLVCGLEVLREAVENLVHGKFFGEEFLMSVATIGAIALGEYSEAVAVMLLFGLGEFLEEKAVGKSRRSIKNLVEIRPDHATVKKDGVLKEVEAEDVQVGDVIVVKPGERVPLDGEVIDGLSQLDTSALTGESNPRDTGIGENVLSGFVNLSGVLEIKVTKPFSESAASRVLALVEESQSKKASTQKFITRFAKVYTPIVCIVAVALAVIPSVILGGGAEVWRTWTYRALELLVVSCPCALVISVPLSFFAGIGLASRKGILVKGSSYIEILNKTKTVVFDKTGTLTRGVFEVTEVLPSEKAVVTKDELLAIATHAEFFSTHPISRSLKQVHHCDMCEILSPENVQEISGKGVRASIDGKKVLVGSKKLLTDEGVEGITETNEKLSGTVVHVAIEGAYQGCVLISDLAKAEAKSAVALLKKNGVEKTVMLTGDNRSSGEKISSELGLDEVHAELLPGDKVKCLEKIISSYENTGKKVSFVGDGINDAPVLTRSDVGIAMGALGSDSAIEAADVVIMDDNLEKVSLALRLARKTMCNVWENVIFALGVKTLIMVLCALGVANMWVAVFGDVGVTMLAVLNSMRLLAGQKASADVCKK